MVKAARRTMMISKDDMITTLEVSDVLLGRGSPTIHYEGNVAFRLIIRARKAEYMASGQNKNKDRVAREIYQFIRDRGGRFLRRVDPVERKALLSIDDPTVVAWVMVEQPIALEKIKQALRDKDHCSNNNNNSNKFSIKARTTLLPVVAHVAHVIPSNQNHSSKWLETDRGTMTAVTHSVPPPLYLQDDRLMLLHLLHQQNTDMILGAHLQEQMQRQNIIKEQLFLMMSLGQMIPRL